MGPIFTQHCQHKYCLLLAVSLGVNITKLILKQCNATICHNIVDTFGNTYYRCSSFALSMWPNGYTYHHTTVRMVTSDIRWLDTVYCWALWTMGTAQGMQALDDVDVMEKQFLVTQHCTAASSCGLAKPQCSFMQLMDQMGLVCAAFLNSLVIERAIHFSFNGLGMVIPKVRNDVPICRTVLAMVPMLSSSTCNNELSAST